MNTDIIEIAKEAGFYSKTSGVSLTLTTLETNAAVIKFAALIRQPLETEIRNLKQMLVNYHDTDEAQIKELETCEAVIAIQAEKIKRLQAIDAAREVTK